MKPSWVNKRRDETEPDIVKALELAGWDVERLPDHVDLLCRQRSTGRLALLEVEGITQYRRRGKEQLAFLKAWEIPIVKTPEQALKAVLG
jgi:hypothetical protein